jgi:glycosyltransferase involved in cell wall biosynthesis
MQKIAIIVPCYNEENRLKEVFLNELLEKTTIDIYLSNDGSKDNTLQKIEQFAELNKERCLVINFTENQGKAATIYKSVNLLSEKNHYDYIGYFDADFSTPPSEIIRLINYLNSNSPTFIFGSRILLLNTEIKRKWHRHIIGRVIITLINLKFKIGVYDTQCGAKIFSKECVSIAFNKEFKTSWLFDVEVFLRLKKSNYLENGIEFPLQKWQDIDGSKLSWKSSLKIVRELKLLYQNY